MQLIFIIVILVAFGLLLYTTLYYRQNYRMLKRELLNEKEQFRSIIASANDGIIIINSESEIITWNRGAEKIFGYQEEEVLGNHLSMIIPEKYRKSHEIGMKRFLSTGKPEVIGKTVELQGLKKDGNEVPLELSLSLWKNKEETYFSGIIRNITERKQAEEMINFLAFHDELTKLPNRRYFKQLFEEEISKAKSSGDFLIVFILDLDDFKLVNDIYGHQFGDLLLTEVANRLSAVIRNKGIIARMGGDEFAMLMGCVKQISEGKDMIDQLQGMFKQPIILDGNEVNVSASIGIAVYPENGKDMESLMKNADMAMYSAKNEDKSFCKFCEGQTNIK